MSGYDQICKDITIKCADDVKSAMLRNMRLMESGDQIVMVAISGMSTAIAASTATIFGKEAKSGPLPDAAIDSMWETLVRPMVKSALGDVGDGTMSDIFDKVSSFKKDTPNG